MPNTAFDLTGRRFGKWAVVSQIARSKHGHIKWLCRCDCGSERIVRTDILVKGTSTSCGCAKTTALHENMLGSVFTRLTVLAFHHRNKKGANYWLCKCMCEANCIVRTDHLTDGKIKSCGCLASEIVSRRNLKHGLRRTPEYKIWDGIIERCCNPKSTAYANYGGRGITICKEWRTDFAAFLSAVGRRPNPKLSIDRIDNNKGYEPGNVRWATALQQAANKRPRQKPKPASHARSEKDRLR